jgi:hypothetical protein
LRCDAETKRYSVDRQVVVELIVGRSAKAFARDVPFAGGL